MKLGINKGIKNLGSQIKSFAGLIGAVIVISSVTNIREYRSEKKQSLVQSEAFDSVLVTLEAVKDATWYNNVQITELSEDVQGIQDTLDEFEQEHRAQGQQINTLAWGLRNIQQFTPEQFEKVLDEMLKKNERLKPRPIALPGVSSILYEEEPYLIVEQ
jgi:wyosine [tRNA(Phe)-imidazoG37] synthetase (radical SAM superfamily)